MPTAVAGVESLVRVGMCCEVRMVFTCLLPDLDVSNVLVLTVNVGTRQDSY